MNDLGITIGGEPFDHLVYHFVLPYSWWETGMMCFSESFETLIAGFQRAVAELGRVPHKHRTDNNVASGSFVICSRAWWEDSFGRSLGT